MPKPSPYWKNITVWVTEEERVMLKELKGNKSWRDFILDLVRNCK